MVMYLKFTTKNKRLRKKFGLSGMDMEYPAEDCGSDNWQLVNRLTGEDGKQLPSHGIRIFNLLYLPF